MGCHEASGLGTARAGHDVASDDCGHAAALLAYTTFEMLACATIDLACRTPGSRSVLRVEKQIANLPTGQLEIDELDAGRHVEMLCVRVQTE
jgi:hypothetical protein